MFTMVTILTRHSPAFNSQDYQIPSYRIEKAVIPEYKTLFYLFGFGYYFNKTKNPDVRCITDRPPAVGEKLTGKCRLQSSLIINCKSFQVNEKRRWTKFN